MLQIIGIEKSREIGVIDIFSMEKYYKKCEAFEWQSR